MTVLALLQMYALFQLGFADLGFVFLPLHAWHLYLHQITGCEDFFKTLQYFYWLCLLISHKLCSLCMYISNSC